MIPSVARDHLEQKRSRPLPIIPRKCIIMYLSRLKKNNIKHFLNGPYIGNFMSLWGGLCFWVCVCVYFYRGLGARRAPSPLQIIQIIQIREIRNILKIKYDKIEKKSESMLQKFTCWWLFTAKKMG